MGWILWNRLYARHIGSHHQVLQNHIINFLPMTALRSCDIFEPCILGRHMSLALTDLSTSVKSFSLNQNSRDSISNASEAIAKKIYTAFGILYLLMPHRVNFLHRLLGGRFGVRFMPAVRRNRSNLAAGLGLGYVLEKFAPLMIIPIHLFIGGGDDDGRRQVAGFDGLQSMMCTPAQHRSRGAM